MAKYFKHPNGITVSEFQMMSISLHRSMDYQVALKIIRDELQGHKESGRYWLASKDKVWKYFENSFDKILKNYSIHDIEDLINRTIKHFSIKRAD